MIYHDWENINAGINSIFSDIYDDGWKPDITLGISPCSIVPALILNNRLRSDFETIKIDLERSEPDIELNAWLPELAFGVNDPEITGMSNTRWDPSLRKNILIFITENKNNILKCLISDWEGTCFPNEKHVWKTIWNNNVKFATLYDYNPHPDVSCDYRWKLGTMEGYTKNIFPWTYEYWTRKY